MDILFFLLWLASIIILVIGIINPRLFVGLLGKRATRKSITTVFGIAGIIFFVLFGITLDTDDTDVSKVNTQEIKKEQQVNEKGATSQDNPIAYKIVETDDLSHKALGKRPLSDYTLQEITALPTNKKMSYRIVVSPDIKENQVRPTIEKIIDDLTIKDGDIDEIYLLLYSDVSLSDSIYDVATATWAPGGKLGNVTADIAKNNDRSNYSISVDVKENLEAYLKQRNAPPEEKFGFSEEKRRQIFKEIVAAEDRALEEADAMYPVIDVSAEEVQSNFMKNAEMNGDLTTQYKAEVRAKYGITEDIESKISVEAFEKRWPLE